ncbi:MAG: hypothetical protein WKF60_08230 [Ilumatobacter sp.]
MTDQINDQIVDEETEQQPGINRRRMFLAGAGIAGAAVVAKAGVANANDTGEPVILGNSGPDGAPDPGGAGDESTSTTEIFNTGTSDDRRNNAIKGNIANPANNSHAILGTTVGGGHAIAGVIGSDAGAPATTVAATWGRHYGLAAATEGQSETPVADVGGDANGVKGIVESPTNGSHAVKGITNGGGHAVAGETPAMVPAAPGSTTMVPNTNKVAATWGKHFAAGAGIGGISINGYGGEFVGGKASVRLIPNDAAAGGPPADAMHMVGELFVDGSGELYYNTADGANFTKLNGQGGTVLLSDIQRAYDSREEFAMPANTNKGRHAAGETRTIDLTEFTDFPAGASGAIINVTVADTSGNGFALVFNATSTTTPLGSSVNWVGSGEFVANGITVATSSDGKVKVYTLQATEVVIDVVGYIS